MAAILCQSISGLCSGLCSNCGKICTLPCTLCSKIFQPLCEMTKHAFSSHFCIYTAVTLGLNIPPVAFALQALTYAGGCKGSQWLGVNLLFCIAHIVCAFYLTVQSKSWMETVGILCYDPWFAAYIITFIAFVIWLCFGVSWSAQGVIADGNCPDNITSLTSNAIYCGFSFIFTGFVAMAVSSLISMCFGKNQNSIDTASNEGMYNEYKSYTPRSANTV